MYELRTGASPASVSRFLAPAAAIVLACVLAGCSSTSAQHQGYGVAMGYQQGWDAKVEIEDDGLPVQTAPRARIHDQPDDPSQPWSPNYGQGNKGFGSVSVQRTALHPDIVPHAETGSDDSYYATQAYRQQTSGGSGY